MSDVLCPLIIHRSVDLQCCLKVPGYPVQTVLCPFVLWNPYPASFHPDVPGICALPENLLCPSGATFGSSLLPFPVHAVSFLPVLSNNSTFVLHLSCWQSTSSIFSYSVGTSLSPACFFHSLCNLFLANFCGALLQCLKHIGRFNFYTDRVIFILILFLILHLVLRQFFNLCHLLCVSCNLLFCDVVGRGKLLADAFIIISESCYHNKI